MECCPYKFRFLRKQDALVSSIISFRVCCQWIAHIYIHMDYDLWKQVLFCIKNIWWLHNDSHLDVNPPFCHQCLEKWISLWCRYRYPFDLRSFRRYRPVLDLCPRWHASTQVHRCNHVRARYQRYSPEHLSCDLPSCDPK